MARWQLTGNYGTFMLGKEIEADSYEEAYEETGIMLDLEDAGWDILSAPEGEEWEVEPLG